MDVLVPSQGPGETVAYVMLHLTGLNEIEALTPAADMSQMRRPPNYVICHRNGRGRGD